MEIKVAIFEDNKLLRESLQQLVNNADDLVCTGAFADANKLFRNIQMADPDVVMMDINMPDMDGYTLTARIKTTPGFERVPILALTANVMRGDKEKTLEAGCDGYIQKPLDIDQLVREVERFLARSA